MSETRGPLAGLVVCEVATVLAGPYCGMLLGDLGADVIKVEPPGGDPTRGWGPPFAGGRGQHGGESAYFLSINRNKRSVELDLHATAGRDALARLLSRSDVLIENFRPGAFAESGFDDARLERVNHGLVHLAITGYGTDGPLADRPGYDFIVQARSGLMSITGAPDEEGGAPTKVGVAITDLTAGMLGTVAVLAALRERDSPAGRGQRIDLSLIGSTLSWLANQGANYLVGGAVPGRLGNAHPNITPYETFATRDGVIAVAVGSEAQWRRFCGVLDLTGLAAEAPFATNATRVANRVALRAVLEPVLSQRTTGAWLELLTAADVPCGPINSVDEAFEDPELPPSARPVAVDHPTAGTLRLPGMPFALSSTPTSVRRPPPLLGEHTEEVFAWLDTADTADTASD
jgi:crotonobetainyl-CoA:carnitine CoA-transferase CaiB-like acyl-CoA transferase